MLMLMNSAKKKSCVERHFYFCQLRCLFENYANFNRYFFSQKIRSTDKISIFFFILSKLFFRLNMFILSDAKDDKNTFWYKLKLKIEI